MESQEIINKNKPIVDKFSTMNHKFTEAEAIEYWNALNALFEINNNEFHLCNKQSPEDKALKVGHCKSHPELGKISDDAKKTAKAFYASMLQKPALRIGNWDASKFFAKSQIKDLALGKAQNVLSGGYYEKYLKYKQKYLALKAELEGGDKVTDCKGKDWKDLQPINIQSTKKLIEELDAKLKSHARISVDEAKVYLSAIEAIFARTQQCKRLSLDEATCANDVAKIKPLYKKFIAEIRPYWKTVDADQKNIAPNLSSYLKDHVW